MSNTANLYSGARAVYISVVGTCDTVIPSNLVVETAASSFEELAALTYIDSHWGL